jgi:hypothetical protein
MVSVAVIAVMIRSCSLSTSEADRIVGEVRENSYRGRIIL